MRRVSFDTTPQIRTFTKDGREEVAVAPRSARESSSIAPAAARSEDLRVRTDKHPYRSSLGCRKIETLYRLVDAGYWPDADPSSLPEIGFLKVVLWKPEEFQQWFSPGAESLLHNGISIPMLEFWYLHGIHTGNDLKRDVAMSFVKEFISQMSADEIQFLHRLFQGAADETVCRGTLASKLYSSNDTWTVMQRTEWFQTWKRLYEMGLPLEGMSAVRSRPLIQYIAEESRRAEVIVSLWDQGVPFSWLNEGTKEKVEMFLRDPERVCRLADCFNSSLEKDKQFMEALLFVIKPGELEELLQRPESLQDQLAALEIQERESFDCLIGSLKERAASGQPLGHLGLDFCSIS